MRITKKRFVLIALFVFPLLFFLFLSTGINKFVKLPTLTERSTDISLNNAEVTFENKVTVLCFLGKDADRNKGGFFNLNQKIYKEFYGYLPFQIIAVYPKGYKGQIEQLSKEIGAFTDMSKWKFTEMKEDDIQSLFQSLQTNGELDQNLYSKEVYILDKNLNLRGRDNDKDTEGGKLYGYNMLSVAELNNKMEDDIKVLLYEYRAALKNRNKADRKKIEL